MQLNRRPGSSANSPRARAGVAGSSRAASQTSSADTFVVYTDSETWFGAVYPAEALRRYRERTGIAAKLIVVGLVANRFSIADPADGGMLDVVGFDTAAPEVIRDFAAA